jgi:adenylosuccinate synthase
MEDKMSKLVTIFGGQMGSEGKGEVASLITDTYPNVIAGVRIGGPNAGHTSYDTNGNKVVVQTIPTPSALFGCDAYIGPEGCFIPELLVSELNAFFDRNPLKQMRLFIDKNATIVTKEHMEREAFLKGKIGSTGEGVGAATADKVMRLPVTVNTQQAELAAALDQVKGTLRFFFLNSVGDHINKALMYNEYMHTVLNPTVIIEGTQGYGLSLHTGGYYPFCTSRECTPFALWAGTGINPNLATTSEVIMVIRTFPIRVGGNSGELPGEITWEQLQQITGGYVKAPEITTVTKKNRRIAHMDKDLVRRAIMQTSPTSLAVTFLDYMFPKVAGMSYKEIVDNNMGDVISYISDLEKCFQVPITIVSTGPGTASYTGAY